MYVALVLFNLKSFSRSSKLLATSCFRLLTRDCELLDLLLFKTDWDQSEVFTGNFDVILARSGSQAAGQPARSIVQK